MGSSKSKIAKVESSLENDKNKTNIVNKNEVKKENETEELEEIKETEENINKLNEIEEKTKDSNSHISVEKLDEFVDEILRDQNININYFPDAVERKLYRNVLILVFSLLNKSIDTASIQFIGHEIKFTMSPLPTKL
jgi:hypothetical protein